MLFRRCSGALALTVLAASSRPVWAEFELARQLIVEGGLILVHDPCLPGGTVEAALGRIEAEGYGVTRLMTASEGVPEDDDLGLAVIENRSRARGGSAGLYDQAAAVGASTGPIATATPPAASMPSGALAPPVPAMDGFTPPLLGPEDLRSVDAALDEHGHDPELLVRRFRCLSDLGQPEEAIRLGRGLAEVAPEEIGEHLARLEAAMARPALGPSSTERSYGTELSRETLLRIQQAVHHYRYRGRQLVKSPFDLALHSLLLENLCPATVFEVGSKSGGSAIWFADLMARLGIEGHVHSFDLFPVDDPHPGVTFHQGDGRQLADVVDDELLAACPGLTWSSKTRTTHLRQPAR